MFHRLIESGNDMTRKLEKHRHLSISEIPIEDRVRGSELYGWESAAGSLIKKVFGEDST
jgi:hypothetical protein